MENKKRLVQGLQEMGIIGKQPKESCEEIESRIKKLERYIAEIELWNPSHGLTATGEDIVSRHIMDSMTALTFIRQHTPPRHMADIGSGAGLPGIPLAIWLNNTQVTLVEKSGRRSAFLHNTRAILSLKNISIIEKPVERVHRKDLNHSGFDLIVFRAWSALNPQIIQTLTPLLSVKGIIMAYKGRRTMFEQELETLTDLPASIEIIPVKVPEESAERHLVIIKTMI